MSQTEEQKKRERYAKVAATMRERYGSDYYKKIGSNGGKKGTSRPFRDRPGLASKAGLASAEKRRQQKT